MNNRAWVQNHQGIFRFFNADFVIKIKSINYFQTGTLLFIQITLS